MGTYIENNIEQASSNLFALEIITTAILLATLIAVIIYTIKTNKMARASLIMAEVQSQELGLRKRPVVAYFLRDETNLFTGNTVINFSMVHAKMRIQAHISVNGEKLIIKDESYYSGKRVWHLQAMDNTPFCFNGNHDLEGIINYNGIPKEDVRQASIAFEIWVINFNDAEKEFDNDLSKNPVAQWNWNGKRWIPEMCPTLA